ncbi:hypothetical protein MrNuV_ORF084 [Macrobrachium rosenbergii nudivirus]|nr:hypothetical protein MrNuV_ORF084 [Macrobrachium rosenbergii nudivirus]
MEALNVFYNSISYERKWAVCGYLYKTYNGNIKYIVDNDNYVSWENAVNEYQEQHTLSEEMVGIINTFIAMNIPKEEFEAFALCKIFLDCISNDNTKSIILYCKYYENIADFIEAIDMLYNSNFTLTNIKLLFAKCLFPDVFEKIPKSDLYDVINILIRKLNDVDVIISRKKLKPYTEYIQNYQLDELQMATYFLSSFKTDKILPIKKFNLLVRLYYNQSKNNIDYRLAVTSQHIVVQDMLIMLNSLYANIILIGIFGYKEESLTHHKELYKNLTFILNQWLI